MSGAVKLRIGYGPTSDDLIEDVVDRLRWRFDKKSIVSTFDGEALIVQVSVENRKNVLRELERVGYVADWIDDEIEELFEAEARS